MRKHKEIINLVYSNRWYEKGKTYSEGGGEANDIICVCADWLLNGINLYARNKVTSFAPPQAQISLIIYYN